MVKSTGIFKKIDQLGRVVLPIEVRKLLDIKEKDELEIFFDEENGRIIFEKASKWCLKCSSTKNLKEIKPGFYLCQSCIDALRST